ncbi:MAG: DUF5946 family protein [Chromatiales bacterium]
MADERPFPLQPCRGCGGMVPVVDAPTPPDINTAAGCWALYKRVLGCEYGQWSYPQLHRLTMDAYAAQHPGGHSPEAIRSLGSHLVGLCAAVALGQDATRSNWVVDRVAAEFGGFEWLEPPCTGGIMTIADVAAAQSMHERERLVRDWGRDVWDWWAPHHATIRRWLDRICA